MWVCHTLQVDANGNAINPLRNFWTGYQWDGHQITGVVGDFEMPSGTSRLGGTYFDGVLYNARWDGGNLLERYDTQGNSLGDFSIAGNENSSYAMACAADPERGYLFVTTLYATDVNGAMAANVGIHVFDIANQFNEVAWMPGLDALCGQANNADHRGRLYWAPEHRNGHLWATRAQAVVNGMSHAFQINVDDQWGMHLVQEFLVPSDVRSPGIAHDGRNLWIGNNAGGFVSLVDDGVAEMPEWLSIAPLSGSIPANQFADMTLTFTPTGLLPDTTYRATLGIESNDPVSPSLVLDVVLTTGNGGPIHFGEASDRIPDGWHQTDVCANVIVTGVTYDNNAVAEGWEVGVFTPDNVLCGGAVWRQDDLGIAIWGATQEYPNQFQNGQTMLYKIWDNQARLEYQAEPTYSQGLATWVGNGDVSILSLAGSSDYTCNVHFTAGWNLISINIHPKADKLIPAGRPNAGKPYIRWMTAAMRNHIVLMKDERGRFYAPAIGDTGFTNIPFWNVEEGYQVRTDAIVDNPWVGPKISNQADVPITAGWNMIAYFPDYRLSCSQRTNPMFYSILPIVDHVVLAKDVLGRFVAPRVPFSNMQDWREGLGYQINVNANVVLNYIESRGQMAALPSVETPETGVVGHWTELASTGENMSVLLTKITGVEMTNGDQVAAFGTDGRLVGVGTVENDMVGLAVWGDDLSTDVVDGLQRMQRSR